MVAVYIAAMLFFAIVRVFGALWFRQVYVEAGLTPWAESLLMLFFWASEYTLILKTLSPLRWRTAVALSLLVRLTTMFYNPLWFCFAVDSLGAIIIPFAANKDKERSVGHSLAYIIAISLYTLVMMFGRGYPLLSRFSVSWQILGTLDYKLFILGIYLAKEATKMFDWLWNALKGGGGCAFLFGKFDRACQKVGHVILHPVASLRGA
jgi:hypothetical protein